MTPMQKQYNEIKEQYPNDVVLFRLGDFYEAFSKDAETISKVLGITLTGRGKGETRIPMAGIPHHALDNYLPKLVEAGLKVVIVDQLTEPKPGQLVERGVSKVYTAGTILQDESLQDSQSNYLLSIYAEEGNFGVAIAELSTGLLQVFETNNLQVLRTEIDRLQPAEVIAPEAVIDELQLAAQIMKTALLEKSFKEQATYTECLEHFGTKNLKGFGIEEMTLAWRALGAALAYMRECQRAPLTHMRTVSIYQFGDFMRLDANTIRNLELVFPTQGTDRRGTVFHHLNNCCTSMGKRKLYDWLLHPLLSPEPLQHRWDSVGFLKSNYILNEKLRAQLQEIVDIERLFARISVGSANARELLALAYSLQNTLTLAELLNQSGDLPQSLKSALITIKEQSNLAQTINSILTSIHSEPPVTTSEGGIIADGYNQQVDELRELRSGGRNILAQIQAREVERTGITSLKVSFNNVFGYYIEITNAHSSKVPADYIRKQTLANAERYITPELKEWEEKILHAEESLFRLEYELFVNIRKEVATSATAILKVAAAIAELDVLSNFAYNAQNYNYSKPAVTTQDVMTIKQNRHLVIERLQPEITANDVHFDATERILILTGPNMSGKSTYIRQIALTVLLAQIGSFVPAAIMEFGLVDRIFTRVGAADNLSRGESTFMVEMNETANILNNATEKSLIILDEVGRGTSTYDGVAIAWAIVEELSQRTKAKTLFATHYHELTELEQLLPNVKNYHVDVQETDKGIAFKHKIISGGTSKSYGVHVAAMAGIPNSVVKRAEEILNQFEGIEKAENRPQIVGDSKSAGTPRKPKQIHPGQLGLGI